MTASRQHKTATAQQHRPPRPARGAELPPELCARLAPQPPPQTPEACRAALVQLGLCDENRPAVTLELYGGLRLRTGCRTLPLHAASVGEALDVLCTVYPKALRLLPADGGAEGHYRFSLNGRDVTADAAHPLEPDDHLIVFSASVGG